MKSILLLHGALGSKEQMQGLRETLKPHFRAHAFSFCGHGKAPARHDAFTMENFAFETLEWMNEHEFQTIDVFGYSMGGYVALWLARYYPERVGDIFTLGTKLDWSATAAEAEIKKLNPEKIAEKVPAFANALAQLHGESAWKNVVEKTAGMMQSLASQPLTDDDFRQINQRILLGLGSDDNMVTQAETELVHALLSHAQFKLLEGVPHPFEKVPLELLKHEIVDFFGA